MCRGSETHESKKSGNPINGNEFTGELTQEIKEIILSSISPICDIRASKKYREKMSIVLLERSLKASLSRMKENKPPYGKDLL